MLTDDLGLFLALRDAVEEASLGRRHGDDAGRRRGFLDTATRREVRRVAPARVLRGSRCQQYEPTKGRPEGQRIAFRSEDRRRTQRRPAPRELGANDS